jgi:hypothetical protein
VRSGTEPVQRLRPPPPLRMSFPPPPYPQLTCVPHAVNGTTLASIVPGSVQVIRPAVVASGDTFGRGLEWVGDVSASVCVACLFFRLLPCWQLRLSVLCVL